MNRSVTENRSYLQKADLVLADLTSGGLLEPAQAQKFMRILIEEAKLMPMTTVVPMRSPKQLIEKIRFAGQVLQPGQEATSLPLAQRSTPDLSKVELDAKLFKAEVRITDEVLEDNIERAELRTTIMQTMGEAVARDMEDVAINGDTASATPLLAVLDGILKQATSNIVNAGTVPLNKTTFRDALKSMPNAFLRDKGRMAFLTSVDAEIDYRDSIADRQTILGDKFLEQEAAIRWSGIPVQSLNKMPETAVGPNVLANMLFCDPKNIHWGIHRKIKIETDRLVREGVLLIVLSVRFDVKYAEETAVVRVNNIKVN